MKTLFFQTRRLVLIMVLAVAAAVSLLAFAPAAVHAQSGGPDGTKRDAKLEQALVRMNDWKTRQEINLRKAGSAGDKLERLIDRAKGNGLDTSALEDALAVYRAALVEAQADHDSAAAILAGHAGFDDAGKVTDAQTARETLNSARKALNDAHITLAQAATTLRAAVNDWRDANPAPVKP